MMKPVHSKQAGATLIEVLIAILIFSIGILAVVGLQAFSIKTVGEAKYRADASFLANQTLGRLWADPGNLADYALGEENIAEFPNGKREVVIDGRMATVTIRWQAPGEPEHTVVSQSFIGINE